MSERYEFNPEWTISPRLTLREIITGHGWTTRSVAAATGVSKSRISQFLHGERYPATWAVAFAKLAGCSPEFIWNLQCNYELDLALGRKDVTDE